MNPRRSILLLALALAGLAAGCSDGNRDPATPPPPPPNGEPPPPVLGEWRTGPSLPEPIQEFHGAVLNGRVYVAGGIGSGNVTLARAYRLDPEAGIWARISDLPAPRHHMPLVAVGDSLYAIGGFATHHFDAERNMWLYVEEEDRWVSRQSPSVARGASSAVALGGKIYLLGGYTHDQRLVERVEVYDPATDRWSQVAPLPVPRDHLAATVVNGEIYVLGGRAIFLGQNSAEVHRYDPAEDTWHTGPAMPATTSGHAAVVLDGQIHVLGGEGAIAYDYHFVLDPGSGVWSEQYAAMPTARHGLAASVVDGRVFAIGGGPSAGFSQTTRVEVFHPDPE